MKKMLSVLLAASLIFGTFTVDISAENTDKIFSAANIFVNSANDDVICDGVTFGQTAEEPTSSNGKVYKECGIFGLSENEYGIEIIAREQRVNKPYMSFDFGDVDASGDFYITQKVYIGQSRDNDLIRLGAPLKKSDGTELKNDQNFQGYKYFQGSGQVKFRDDKLSDATKYQNASCATNNWVNYTVAGIGGEIATYVDGVKFDSGWVDGISGGNKTVTYSGTLTDVQTAIRFQTADTAVGLPSFAVLKEAKLIYGTYDPEQSKTVITSTAYAVPQATVLLGSSTSNPAKVGTV
ncbi:MAG: hypothetical protein K5768_10660, partial [Firmicutes bacterium]|nr:hypothetical protein [Bacillota bacterium]